jgi:protoporphyrinogen oxidase
MENKKTALIIGAGPAGLTAAYELLKRSDYKPIVLEMTDEIGGISKTVNYKGNRIDIGGHRFFSKSERVMKWWQEILPLQGSGEQGEVESEIKYHNKSQKITLEKDGPSPEKTDKVMLLRQRLSRIFFLRKFFSYPVSLSLETIRNLGIIRMIKIGTSYIWVRLFPIKNELSLEDFFINRFGRQLYLTFFKDYTEKVWGTSCRKITAEWGAQRIKGLSISKAVVHALVSPFKKNQTIHQKDVETSLIDQFMYPKHGPGQLWEEVADIIVAQGGQILFNKQVVGLNLYEDNIEKIVVSDVITKREDEFSGDIVFSTMPVKDLIGGMQGDVPENVRNVAENLPYRDFMTVGLLLKELKIKNSTNIESYRDIVPDNWIYIQEREVKLGRLQIFNNWSPYMVADPDTVWIGLEYFCNEGDGMWNMADEDFIQFAINELSSIDIIEKDKVLDHTLLRVAKTYPSYFGTYNEFDVVKDFVLNIDNLHLVGRNGMHKYNNQDHSMLTAMVSVDNLVAGVRSKKNIWEINTEVDYHEKK